MPDNNDKELPEILPCASCGGRNQHIESSRPEGRVADIWRVTCPCGGASAMWSVSKSAAVRLWNRYMSEAKGQRK